MTTFFMLLYIIQLIVPSFSIFCGTDNTTECGPDTHLTCDGPQQCDSHTLHCLPQQSCNIECTGGEYSCSNAIISAETSTSLSMQCSSYQSCKTSIINAGNNANVSLYCTETAACKYAELTVDNSLSRLNVHCTAASSCNYAYFMVYSNKTDVNLLCDGDRSCYWFEMLTETVKSLTVNCNKYKSCSDAGFRCGTGQCSVKCNALKSCYFGIIESDNGGDVTIDCIDTLSCQYLYAVTDAANTIIINCMGDRSCLDGELNCAVGGTCSLNCATNTSCTDITVNIEGAHSFECIGNGCDLPYIPAPFTLSPTSEPTLEPTIVPTIMPSTVVYHSYNYTIVYGVHIKILFEYILIDPFIRIEIIQSKFAYITKKIIRHELEPIVCIASDDYNISVHIIQNANHTFDTAKITATILVCNKQSQRVLMQDILDKPVQTRFIHQLVNESKSILILDIYSIIFDVDEINAINIQTSYFYTTSFDMTLLDVSSTIFIQTDTNKYVLFIEVILVIVIAVCLFFVCIAFCVNLVRQKRKSIMDDETMIEMNINKNEIENSENVIDFQPGSIEYNKTH
eukprot:539296_1